MTNEPKSETTDAVAKGKRTNRPKQVIDAECINVRQLAQMADKDRSHPARHSYYGVPGVRFSKKGDPISFNKKVAQAILKGEQSPGQTDNHTVQVAPPAPEAPTSTSTDTMPQGIGQPASDLPFRYQPGSAVRAGRRVAPGFEHCTLDEYERNEKELRASGKLYDD